MARHQTRRRKASPSPHPTRERLIDEMTLMIDEVGIDGIDMHEMLRRAGVTTGALYHHFRDLGHLVEEALARRFPVGVRESLAHMREGLANAADLESYLAFMRTLAEVSQAPANRSRRMERAHTVALAFSSEPLREIIARQQSELTTEVTEVLAEIQQRGWLRADLNPRAVAVFIQAYTLGRIIDDITDDPVEPAEWNHLIVTVMTETLSAPAS